MTARTAPLRRLLLLSTFAVPLTLLPAVGAGATARPAQSVNASPYVGLGAGSRGQSVKDVQAKLISLGYTLNGGADGIFGPSTEKAVRAFQKANGIASTGTIDETTTVALGLAAAPAAAAIAGPGATPASPMLGLQRGSTGDAVVQLQTLMRQQGFVIRDADGTFGASTESALRLTQRFNKIDETGTVTPATVRILDLIAAAAPATPATPAAPAAPAGGQASAYVGLQVGSRGTAVRELQSAIIRSGVVVRGGADGIFGNGTRSAVILVQRFNKMAETGVVDEPLARLLGLLGSSPAPSSGQSGYAQYGERGARVKALQQALLNAGVPVMGGADGIFGASTAGAVMNFQRAKGLSPTGKVDDATAQLLGLAAAPVPQQPATPASLAIGTFPVQGPCWFGDTWHAPRGGGRLHEGVDIIAKEGQALYAVTTGKVSQIFYDQPGSLGGNALKIARPDGTYFFYAHLVSFADGIALGVPVTEGQVIGYVGKTGNAAGAHVHFEVHPGGGAAVNPYPIVKAIDRCKG
jgi:peptidoglycan hydrolase-like protein with peptidoglycan-binding domain